jgi:hypothetical protein
MRFFISSSIFIAFFFFSLTASAQSFSYTLINQNLCSKAPYGFTATWLGGRSGCLEGSVCVMSSPAAGDPPNIPTCMPNEAAANVNYADRTSCAVACGRTCTVNQNNSISTYYCASSPCTDIAQSPLPCATYAGNLGIPSGHTIGNASWTANSCNPSDQTQWKYSSGCSIPASTGATQKCPAGTPADIDGNYWLSDQKTPCTPTAPAMGGSVGSPNTGGTSGNFVGQTSPPGQNVTLINPLKGGTSLMSFLNSILDFIIQIGTIVVILMMVFVGYKFVAARGEPAKITEARSALLWTLVGALILLGSKAIAIGIEATVQAL